MQVTYLLPEGVARESGSGPELALGASRCKPLLLTLGINRIVERESLEISIWGSSDRENWRRLEVFPQKFYCGKYTRALDLTRHPDVRFLRAEWKMGRWGHRMSEPLFGFYLLVEEPKMHAVGA
jgi:hypothetical protein